jgi:hypothetical protein
MDLITLKESLPRGYVKLLQKRIPINKTNVSRMIHGKVTMDLAVADALVDIAQEYAARKRELEMRIKELR